MRYTPTLSIDSPDGWLVKEQITILEPTGRANVIVSSEPLGDPEIDTERYASVQGDLLEGEFPGYEEISFEAAFLFGGRSGRIRHFRWRPADGTPVTQLQIYLAESGRGYTATATATEDEFSGLEQALRDALDSLTFESSP